MTDTPHARAAPAALVCLLAAALAVAAEENAPMAKRPDSARSPAGTRAPTILLPAHAPAGPIALDGSGQDPLWAQARALPPLRLAAEYACDPAMDSRAAVVRAGRWLLLALAADETGTVVARETVHGADLWREDAFVVELGGARTLRVLVNPLGAVRCDRGGRRTMAPITRERVRAAARVRDGGWRVELAVDLREVLADKPPGRALTLRVTRQRQQRGLRVFEAAAFPQAGRPAARLDVGGDRAKQGNVRLDVAAPQRLVECTVLEAGRVEAIPAGDAPWAKMPARLLQPEHGGPVLDAAFQPTVVRAAVAQDRLALRIRCEEAHPDSIVARGEAIWAGDCIEVFLGPEGFNYLQLLTNPAGALEAAWGKAGGRNVRAVPVPAGVTVRARKRREAWTVELTVPLRAVTASVGAPARLVPAAWPWRVQIVRTRPARGALAQAAQVSVLNVTHSGTSHCPARFARLRVRGVSGERVAPPRLPEAELPPPVLSPERRRALGAPRLLEAWVEARARAVRSRHEAAFGRITDAAGWQAHAGRIRKRLAELMFPAAGGRMPRRGPLEARCVYDLPGEGFRCRGVIFQSRAHLPVPATVYVPAKRRKPPERGRPALIMVPAHHTGRNSRDLIVLGATFARAGGVALAVESLGSGERAVAAPWAHKNHQRSLLGRQVLLAGDNLAGWTTFDISRAIDYLLERGDVDAGRIALVGGVAGGGDVSALAAALDERIAVSIPFNFSTTEPMDAWYDPLRSYHGADAVGLTAWTVAALAAPRRLVQAEEFDWTPARRRSHARFEKLYGWLGAAESLAKLHGGPNTHATHFAAVHRLPLYAILNRWFGMALPAAERDECRETPPPGKLDCFETPGGRKCLAELARAGRLREPHELAGDIARRRLGRARRAAREASRRAGGSLARAVADGLAALVGDAAPVKAARAVPPAELGTWRGEKVLGAWLPAEDGRQPPGLAVWLLMPARRGRRPAVLGVCRAGKARFLFQRGEEVRRLLAAGIAVCLADLRGCGETSPGGLPLPDGPAATLAYRLWSLDDSLPARQLKDVRTVLAWLAARKEVDAARLALWGEGFSRPVAPAGGTIRFDETGFRQCSPVPKEPAEPLGGLLAMLAALRPIEASGGDVRVRAVLVRGTLVSFLSALDRRCHYVPSDAIVPGLLRAADVPMVAEALADAGVALRAEDLRDGSNRRVAADRLREAWGPAAPPDYADRPTDQAAAFLIRALSGKG